MAGSYLLVGHLEWLAWQELLNKREARGLGMTCISSRGQALFSKQFCLQVVAGGTLHSSALWVGQAVGHYIPSLAVCSHASNPTAPFLLAGEVLVEIFSNGTVPPNRLQQAMSASIYAAFLDTPPPTKLESRWPFAWNLVWQRL